MAKGATAPEASEQAPEPTEPKPPHHSAIASPPDYNDTVIDPRLHSTPVMKIPSHTPQIYGTDSSSGPRPTRIHDFDGSAEYIDGNASTSVNYQDLLIWDDLSMDMNLYRSLTAVLPENMHLVFSDQGEVSSGSDIISGSTQHQPSTSHTGSCSTSSVGDHDMGDMALSRQAKRPCCDIAPQSQEELAWPLARCNPHTSSNTCPRTAVVYLESLGQDSRHGCAWDSPDLEPEQAISASDFIYVKPITLGARDDLEAITQGFLHRALEAHRGGCPNKCQNGQNSSPTNFRSLIFPPTNVLEDFIRQYTRHLSKYYLLDAGGKVEPNELIHGNHASALLILLMISQGASMSSSTEARCLSVGLTEICNISLSDITEQDIEHCADPTVLRCALLFAMLGAWSGHKWHMDTVMGRHGMYLTMLKHAGMLEPQDISVPRLSGSANVEVQWRAWVVAETRSR